MVKPTTKNYSNTNNNAGQSGGQPGGLRTHPSKPFVKGKAPFPRKFGAPNGQGDNRENRDNRDNRENKENYVPKMSKTFNKKANPQMQNREGKRKQFEIWGNGWTKEQG